MQNKTDTLTTEHGREDIPVEKKKFKDMDKHERANRILYFAVLLSLAVPVVFLILRMIFSNGENPNAGYHSEADYALMLVQCAMGIVAIHIPMMLERTFKFDIPIILYSMYIIFLYCAIFLGEVGSFYYKVPFWDTILHAFSSLMLGAFGFMLVAILNHSERVMVSLSPAFLAIFAFCFAVAIGAIWEIYEYTFDGLLGLNMQKFMTADGTVLVGHEALSDTMKDIMVDALGAAASSVVGFVSIKKGLFWLMPRLRRM